MTIHLLRAGVRLLNGKFARVGDADVFGGLSAAGADLLHGLNDVHALEHLLTDWTHNNSGNNENKNTSIIRKRGEIIHLIT